MEYKFNLTPRLISLVIFCAIALMVLLFALGYQIGKSSSAGQREDAAGMLDDAGQRARLRAEQRLESRAAAGAARLAAPVTAPLRNAEQAVR